jgi:putative DNA-binding protein
MTTPLDPLHDLGQIQRWMQATIMHPVGVAEGIASPEARRHIDVGPDAAETVVTRSRALTALERLAIYSYAYYARLLECLREEFPVLKHALGEEVFDAFAVEYLKQYPSRSYTLLQLGVNFPGFLAETRPDRKGEEKAAVSWPDFLIDLATLELTFNEVFDGPGVEGEHLLDASQLKAVSPERLLEARLVGVPCLRLLTLRYPVHQYFTAVRRHQDPDPPGPADTYLAITRRRYVVRHFELSGPAYELLHALVAGEPVGVAISRAAEAAGPDLERLAPNLQAWFHDWAAEGFFRAVELGKNLFCSSEHPSP